MPSTGACSPWPGRSRLATGDGPGSLPRRRPATTDPAFLAALPSRPTTRFAPAPTGWLHLGHVANALWVWGVARLAGGRVLLRIEDHDRQRGRAEYDAGIMEDLAWLGFVADAGPVRQTDPDGVAAYGAALARLRGDGRVYACACTRATFAAWASEHGTPWRGPGCPGGCRALGLADAAGLPVRVDLGGGDETFEDLRLGQRGGPVPPAGDLVVRDRHGHWAYGFAVVVDDRRQAIDLVVRGEDLLDATPGQVRLARLLGRERPPAFLHHPLIRKAGGPKLSKSDGDTGVRELRAAGWSPGRVIAEAAARGGVPATLAEAARPG